MRRDAGVFGAVAAIAAMVTAGFSWVSVLLGWGIGTLIMLLLPSSEDNFGKPAAWCLLLESVVVMAAAAMGAEDAFPEDSTFPFVSAVLLLILWRAMCGERRTLGNVANVLGLLLLPVLAAVLLGLKDVSWRENLPQRSSWFEIYITIGAMSPWWCLSAGRRRKSTWIWFGTCAAVSLGFSLLTRGILGNALVETEPFPLYRAVQTIRILGVLQRFEALLAAAVLMGAFAVLLLAAEKAATALDVIAPDQPRCKKCGAVALAAFLMEWGFRQLPWGTAETAEAVFWGVIPILALWVVFSGKIRKIEKSS